MAAQFWLQVFFPLCIQSYSAYSSLSLLCAFVAEKREHHMKELHQHFHVGHNMINKNPIISRFCTKKGIDVNQCVLVKRNVFMGACDCVIYLMTLWV